MLPNGVNLLHHQAKSIFNCISRFLGSNTDLSLEIKTVFRRCCYLFKIFIHIPLEEFEVNRFFQLNKTKTISISLLIALWRRKIRNECIEEDILNPVEQRDIHPSQELHIHPARELCLHFFMNCLGDIPEDIQTSRVITNNRAKIFAVLSIEIFFDESFLVSVISITPFFSFRQLEKLRIPSCKSFEECQWTTSVEIGLSPHNFLIWLIQSHWTFSFWLQLKYLTSETV